MVIVKQKSPGVYELSAGGFTGGSGCSSITPPADLASLMKKKCNLPKLIPLMRELGWTDILTELDRLT